MADKTGIEWTDATWNPLRGCSRVSEGCRHCYAETIAARFSGPGQPYHGIADPSRTGSKWTGQVKLVETALGQPLRWKKPRRIFVNSMSDLFHESVSDEWIDHIFAVMALSQQHNFQILTKRPERMLSYSRSAAPQRIAMLLLDGFDYHIEGITFAARMAALASRATDEDPERITWPLQNVWLGVSVEDQATADERIPLLLSTPAAHRFISAEPLLGPIDLERVGTLGLLRSILPAVVEREESEIRPNSISGLQIDTLHGRNQATIFFQTPDHMGGFSIRFPRPFPRLDWVIVGGESGIGARPMHPDWARALRDQCATAGVPFFFKQWGEWEPNATGHTISGGTVPGSLNRYHSAQFRDDVKMNRVGKKAAGCALDDVEHKAMP